MKKKYSILDIIAHLLVGVLFGFLIGIYYTSRQDTQERKFTLEEITSMSEYSYLDGANGMIKFASEKFELSEHEKMLMEDRATDLTKKFKHNIDSICRLAEQLKE